MAGGAVILHRATEKDIKVLAAFFQEQLDGLGVRHTITSLRLKNVIAVEGAQALNVALEKDRIVAALWAQPIQTDKGLGWEVCAIAMAADYPDRIRAFDAVCLFSLNRSIPLGRHVIFARHDTAAETITGVELMDMEGIDAGIDPDTGKVKLIEEWGNAEDIINDVIYPRNPDWVTGLDSLGG